MWVKLFAACSFMSFEFFWYLLISFDHMPELWTYPLHQVRMPRLLPKKAWLDWLDHGLGSVELLWNYVARPCKTLVDFFILLQSSSSWCSNMLKHVSRPLLIFAYLSLYLFYEMLHPAELLQHASIFYWHGHFIHRFPMFVYDVLHSARIIQNQICGCLGLWNDFLHPVSTHFNLTGATGIL